MFKDNLPGFGGRKIETEATLKFKTTFWEIRWLKVMAFLCFWSLGLLQFYDVPKK